MDALPGTRGTARTSAGSAGPAIPRWPRDTAVAGGVDCCTNAGAWAALANERTSTACLATVPPSRKAVDRTTVHPCPGMPVCESLRDAQVPTGLSLAPSGHQLT